MAKQQKYAVLSIRELKALIRIADQYPELGDANALVIYLEASSKKHPGQLTFTNEFLSRVYENWEAEE